MICGKKKNFLCISKQLILLNINSKTLLVKKKFLQQSLNSFPKVHSGKGLLPLIIFLMSDTNSLLNSSLLLSQSANHTIQSHKGPSCITLWSHDESSETEEFDTYSWCHSQRIESGGSVQSSSIVHHLRKSFHWFCTQRLCPSEISWKLIVLYLMML